MKIKLDRETMPDELYNQLLQNFVNTAVEQGLAINGKCQFENWNISCDVTVVSKHHIH